MMRITTVAVAGCAVVGMIAGGCGKSGQKQSGGDTMRKKFTVTADVETKPVRSSGDAADDMCIWIHPDDPEKSRIIGTDKNEETGGLCVYDLQGNLVQFVDDPGPNNVDCRYGFTLTDNREIDVVTASCDRDSTIMIYGIDEENARLHKLEAREIHTIKAYGIGMYKSPESGKMYSFVNDRQGNVVQWLLKPDGSGKIDAEEVRRFSVSSKTEGCVADDEAQVVYIGEEARGIWKFAAEPDDTAEGVLIDSIHAQGPMPREDVEGLALYKTGQREGYLLASSQGDSSFAVYSRTEPHAYIGSFTIVGGDVTDGAEETDGIEATGVALGAQFPRGVFVVQDGINPGANQNFKYVAWEKIAHEFEKLRSE